MVPPASLAMPTSDVISSHMSRLMTLLLILALALSNGAAVSAAICQHQDEAAHAAARGSADRGAAAEALVEESAAAAAEKQTAGEIGGASLAGFILPRTAGLPPRPSVRSVSPAAESPHLSGRSLRPLLEPPAA